ncbi:MAG: NAD-dependent epimerase/dehydratase family protein [Mitsuaria chitosanitabida]|uniref:NAD-dependent epimerase/dehydratase family protein n=1 Tax=Roseateles chitosanitabidus TaxID=65048 RepID=UPI001B07418D|nr:NAD-dependent epimerase/dehydratase family protein [Roseateles chitosanitabidus]MBO9688657.1 NAD-dependent epimerase/dehydratase family protein [Roseateles chitosanitabidus]
MTATSNAIVEADLRAIAARDLPWDQLSGRRVVVTGAGGFLGGYLVRTLLALHRLGCVAQPLHVVALVRNVDRARERFSDLAQDGQLEFMAWDLNTIAVPDLGDVHYVLHAASQASPRFYGTDPVGTLLPNTVGTAALLEALRRSADPKGFLFVSSSEVYGAVNSTAGLKEADYGVVNPTQVRACYAESKRAGETTCVSFHHQHGIPTWIVRPFHTYGPGLTAEDGRVFSDFTYNVLRNEDIVMNSDGTARRAFCYASDAVAGFFAVLLRGEAGTAYNVANAGAEMSVMEFAELMVGLFPEKGLRVDRRVDTSSPNYMPSAYNRLVPDTARLESLGWKAEVTPAQGFKRMIEALQ